MSGAAGSTARLERHMVARTRRRRDDLWLACTALAAALAALPLAPSPWRGPEVASTLAVAAVALLAGQRWAIAVIVVAELLLVPTLWPRAFLGDLALQPARVAALLSLVLVVPGVLSARRAAAAMALLTGWPRTRALCRRLQLALVAVGTIAFVLPLL